MKRFKNLFLLYDDAIGGDDALGQALALCRSNNANLTIATLLPGGAAQSHVKEAGKRLLRLVENVRDRGPGIVNGELLAGIPLPEVIRRVSENNHDLVILSEELGMMSWEARFGGLAAQLMRKCPCPVWVIRPEQVVPYRRVLAAVDPAPNGGDDHLNRKIMDLAVSLASRDHAALHVIHAWEVVGGDLDTIRSETSDQMRQDILQKHARQHEAWLATLLDHYPMKELDHQLHLPRGQAGDAIVGLVESQNIDLLVMGTAGRTGLRGLVFGNAVETVLRAVKCGIMAVKPDQYRPPFAMPETMASANRDIDESTGLVRRIA